MNRSKVRSDIFGVDTRLLADGTYCVVEVFWRPVAGGGKEEPCMVATSIKMH